MPGIVFTPHFLVAYLAAALIIAMLGRRRSMGFWGYFFGSLVLTPIIGLLLLMVSGPRKT